MLIIRQKANLILFFVFQINLLDHKTIGCGRLQLWALRIFTDVAIDISEINRGGGCYSWRRGSSVWLKEPAPTKDQRSYSALSAWTPRHPTSAHVISSLGRDVSWAMCVCVSSRILSRAENQILDFRAWRFWWKMAWSKKADNLTHNSWEGGSLDNEYLKLLYKITTIKLRAIYFLCSTNYKL